MLSWQRGVELRPDIRSCKSYFQALCNSADFWVTALVSSPFSMGAVIQTSEWPSLLFPVFQTNGFFFLEAWLLPRMVTTKIAVYIRNSEAQTASLLLVRVEKRRSLRLRVTLVGRFGLAWEEPTTRNTTLTLVLLLPVRTTECHGTEHFLACFCCYTLRFKGKIHLPPPNKLCPVWES